nr:hypothetical protein [Megavirus caiporensis]
MLQIIEKNFSIKKNYMFLLPKIFKTKVLNITYDTNFDQKNNNIDDLKYLSCDGTIHFINNCSLESYCSFHPRHDVDDDYFVRIEFFDGNKYHYLEHNLFSNMEKSELSKNSLQILDKLDMEKTIVNMRMLFVLLSNFILETRNICDPDDYHRENISIISCKELETIRKNFDENNNKKCVWYENNHKEKFKFVVDVCND